MATDGFVRSGMARIEQGLTHLARVAGGSIFERLDSIAVACAMANLGGMQPDNDIVRRYLGEGHGAD